MASASCQNKSGAMKRKIADERRAFQEKWTDDYFFVESNNKALCLLCREVVSVFKDYNLKRHYIQMHPHLSELQGECRRQKILDLKKENLTFQQQLFRKSATQPDSLVKASYVVSNLIAKKSKPFADGEFIKECLESVADVICPEKQSDFSKISLSHQTVARCVEDIAKYIENTLESRCTTFKFYSIALDDCTDVTDTTQLAIFIRGVDINFNITEELASLIPLKDSTTKSVDLYNALKATLTKFSLTIKNMSGIVTDSAPAMVGKKEGLTTLMEEDAKQISNVCFMKYHCIIHQENMCAQILKMENVMNVVIKTINFIRSRGLNHRQFQEFLNTLETSYGDIVYFTAVRWLSRCKMLKHFYDLRNEIKCFMESKGKPVPEFENASWMADLAFLVDITAHLNDLNLRLQGENLLINDMFQTVTAFEVKLKLWHRQIKNNNLIHFETLSEQNHVNTEKYAALINSLSQDFESRFQDFRKHQQHFSIFATPFSVDINMLPANLQLECIELQSDIQLKEKFLQESLLDFYKLYLSKEKYPSLHEHALFMTSLLGSTYICEQFFSRMKYTKSKIRTKISDEHLENTLRIATVSIKTDVDALISKRQAQCSH
ncbi:general transcription factor II-I repeat domain-containing protein 2B-like isoform X2 [Protopterus annectens]|nr:general transcription factor II-I repeat domain-containing protein 2B-like isoform X2 [Protopterus annectens]